MAFKEDLTFEELVKIDPSELQKYSYDDTCRVLKTLETIDYNEESINIIENKGILIHFLNILSGRAYCNKGYTPFKELLENDIKKKDFILWILIVKDKMNVAFSSTVDSIEEIRGDIEENIKKADELNKNTDEKIKKQGDKIKEYDNKIKEYDDKIYSLESRLISNVLTIMGVFSAIITIIMSVVATSSSWLKDAQNASAILAFVIPSAVVVLSMSILLGFVFYQKEKSNVIKTITDFDTNEQTKKILKKSKFFFYLTIIFAVVAIGFSIVYSSINLSKTSVHSRYIISQGIYVIKEVQNDENPENKSIIIEFEFNQKNYVFPYDESLIHGGKIFFCEEHNMLE